MINAKRLAAFCDMKDNFELLQVNNCIRRIQRKFVEKLRESSFGIT